MKDTKLEALLVVHMDNALLASMDTLTVQESKKDLANNFLIKHFGGTKYYIR